MPKLSAMLPQTAKYLKAEDIPAGRDITLTIERIELRTLIEDAHEQSKPVVFFCGKEKGLVLNQTNATTLIEAYGDDIDSMRKKTVILYRDVAPFRGRSVPCLRLRIPRQ